MTLKGDRCSLSSTEEKSIHITEWEPATSQGLRLTMM